MALKTKSYMERKAAAAVKAAAEQAAAEARQREIDAMPVAVGGATVKTDYKGTFFLYVHMDDMDETKDLPFKLDRKAALNLMASLATTLARSE